MQRRRGCVHRTSGELRQITITCADCGEMQVIPPLSRGGAAACHRCDRLLERRTHTRYDLTLACAAAILLTALAGYAMNVRLYRATE